MSDFRVLSGDDPEIPDLLRSIDDRPATLFVRGRLDCGRPAIAIVGSRRPTEYGRRTARRIASEAARAGVVVVSGLARGIDAEAHRAALTAGGLTWAVLGSGLDRIYPSEHAQLAEEIVSAGGALISEFSSGTPPRRENFPRRNRIISGLCWGTLVVEGARRSGSLITARTAAEQGRAVFAVPGPADSPMSEGPHELLRQGAALARGFEDIVAELPMLAPCDSGAVGPKLSKIVKYTGTETHFPVETENRGA